MSVPVELKGRVFTYKISFPWDRGVFISIEILDKDGRFIDAMEKPIGQKTLKKFGVFIPIAKKYVDQIFQDLL